MEAINFLDLQVHEIKYDGYRTQLAIDGKDRRAYTRNGYDWTDQYGIVVAAAHALKCRSAVIDGEMCVQNADGVTNFGQVDGPTWADRPTRLCPFGRHACGRAP